MIELGDINFAEEFSNPSFDILLQESSIYFFLLDKSVGVTQTISPFQYSFISVFGVPPPVIIPILFRVVIPHLLGIFS